MPLVAVTEVDTSEFWSLKNAAGRKANRELIPRGLKLPPKSDITILDTKDSELLDIVIRFGDGKFTSILATVESWDGIMYNKPLADWFSDRFRAAISRRKGEERAFTGWENELARTDAFEHPELMPF